MRHGDAGDRAQALAQHDRHGVHVAGACLAIHQPHVNAGVHLALCAAGVDGGQGVAHFGQLPHQRLYLACLGLGGLQRRAHGGVEVDGGLGVVGLGHKLRAQQRHHEHADHENPGGQCQRSQLVRQRPAQDALVELRQALGGVVEPAGDTANGFVVQRARGAAGLAVGVNARVVPDAGEHGVEREADEHRNQYRRHDGDAEFVEELADDPFHEADGQEHGDDGQRSGQHRQADFLRAIHGCLVGTLAHLHMAHDVFAHHDGIVD